MRKYGVIMRRVFGTQAPALKPSEVEEKYNNPTRSEKEDKELMRQAILKEIRKAVKDQIKTNKDQTPMDLEEKEMTMEDGSTSVMIGELDVSETPQPEGVFFTDEHSSWSANELLAFGTLLR